MGQASEESRMFSLVVLISENFKHCKAGHTEKSKKLVNIIDIIKLNQYFDKND